MIDRRRTIHRGAAALVLALLATAAVAGAAPAPEGDGPRIRRTFSADGPATGYFADSRFDGACEAGFFTDRTFGSAVHAEDGEWSIEISQGRCELEIELTGEIDLRPDGRGIARMGRDARMTIEEDAAALLARAADTLGSDHELAELMTAVPSRLLADPAVGRAYVEAARSIGSDHEAARVLLALAESFPEEEPLPAGFFRIAEGIGSDHELGRVLAAVIEEGRTDEATVAAVLGAAEGIGSDHELSQLLVLVAGEVRPEGELRARFLEVAESVGSDYERERVTASLD